MDWKTAVDFKKMKAIELQINLQEWEEDSRFTFVTDSAFIEGRMNLQESGFDEKSRQLGRSLHKMEREPNIDTTQMDVINIKAAFYLEQVTITPFANQNAPVHLDEFILFSDHISGVTLLRGN